MLCIPLLVTVHFPSRIALGFQAPNPYTAERLTGTGAPLSQVFAINDNDRILGTAPLHGGAHTVVFHTDIEEDWGPTSVSFYPPRRGLFNSNGRAIGSVGFEVDGVFSGIYQRPVLIDRSGWSFLDFSSWTGNDYFYEVSGRAVNDSGTCIGNDGEHGGVWFNYGSSERVDDYASTANSINNLGQIAGSAIWNANGAGGYVRTDLGGLSSPVTSIANAINDLGVSAGASQDSSHDYHAVTFDASGFAVDLGFLPSSLPSGQRRSIAKDINNNGEIVGQSRVDGGAMHAFIYTSGVMYDLNTLPGLTGLNLVDASQINNWGEILAQDASGDWYRIRPQIARIDTTRTPPLLGSALGGGNYALMAAVNLQAIPGPGSVFKGWYRGGSLVTTNLSYELRAFGNQTFEARFQYAPQGLFVHPIVLGGTSVLGRLSLGFTAKKDTTFKVSTTTPGLVTPSATVVVKAGSAGVNFYIPTIPVAKDSLATVQVSGSPSLSSTFKVVAPGVASLKCLGSKVGGQPIFFSVSLNAPAPKGGMPVSVTANNAVIDTSGSPVIVPVGARTLTFSLPTAKVSKPVSVQLKATSNGHSATCLADVIIG